jgi:hypothetical protein
MWTGSSNPTGGSALHDNDETRKLIDESQQLLKRSAHMAEVDEELRSRLQSIQDRIDKLKSKQNKPT